MPAHDETANDALARETSQGALARETSQDALARAGRIVVKVGSALICDEHGQVNEPWLRGLAADIQALRNSGRDVVVVTSGAIALGRRRLGLKKSLRLDEKQAASAAGQVQLAQAWQQAFEPFDTPVAQILLTLDDTENRRRYINARMTLESLAAAGAVAVVNENDTIATSEIRYGDNDRLAAHTAQLFGADLLLILSDIDGLYTADPRADAAAAHIPLVQAITPAISAMASGPNREANIGSGGMESKLAAARIAADSGCETVIASGRVEHPIQAVANGARSTLFLSATDPRTARRKWIGGRLKTRGEIRIDAGARRAIEKGASLLPAGVTDVWGDFVRGDAVLVLDENGLRIGCGLASFGAVEMRSVIGRRSEEIEQILGYACRPAAIERDNLVMDNAPARPSETT